jgi:hypothetical protein
MASHPAGVDGVIDVAADEITVRATVEVAFRFTH